MTKRMLWYVCLGLLCCVAITAVVSATANSNSPVNTTPMTSASKAARDAQLKAQLSPSSPTAIPRQDAGIANKVAPTIEPAEASVTPTYDGNTVVDAAGTSATDVKVRIEDLVAEIQAAKAAGQVPNPNLYEQLEALMGPRDRTNPLDEGNEACPGLVIGALPYADTGDTGDNIHDVGVCAGNTAPDVIYELTPTETGNHTISLCGSAYDTRLEIRTDGACPGTTEAACNDDFCGLQSQITMSLNSGQVYWIIVDGFVSNFGAYTLNVTGPPPPVGNDNCATAAPMTVPGQVSGNTCAANNDYDAVCPYTGSTSPDVVYTFTAAANDQVTFTLCNGPTDYDTKLYIYANDCAGPEVACNDDFCTSPEFPSPYVSRINCFQLVAGTTYYVVVDGYGFSCGNFTLDAEICVPCENPPPNDICENAVVAVLPFSGNGDNTCALEECPDLSGGSLNDVWYTFTTTEECNVAVTFCGTTDPDFTQNSYIVLSTVCGGGQCQPFVFANNWNWTNCGDGNITLNWLALPAGTYWYPVLGQTAVIEGAFTINITCTPPPPCIPDFSVTAPVSDLIGNTTGAGDDCQAHFSEDQIVEIVIPNDGEWTFSLCDGGTTYDSYLYLRTACCSGTVLWVVDDYCGLQSEIHCLFLTAGTYYLAVEGFGGGTGSWQLDVTECAPCLPTPANDMCENADVAILPFSGTGDNTCANEECANLSGGFYHDVWYTFTTTGTCDLSISFCGTTDPDFTQNSYIVLSTVCGGGQCTPFVFANSWNWTECGDGNITLSWMGLPAGTYWYPVLGQEGFIEGPFTININCSVCEPAPANDNCVDAGAPVALPATFTGNNDCSTHDCGLIGVGEGETWHVFTVEPENAPCDLIIDFCDTDPGWGDIYIVLVDGCPCNSLIFGDLWEQTNCPNGNWTLYFNGLPAGTYYYPILRNSGFGAEGPYTVQVECDLCEQPQEVTAYRGLGPNNDINIRYLAPEDGRYEIWATTNKNHDGNPDDGADPDWALLTTQDVLAGDQLYTHTGTVSTDSYVNYVVVQNCAPMGRCCYNESTECADNTQSQCDALGGFWVEGLTCADPCPPPPPANDLCQNATQIFSGQTAVSNAGSFTDGAWPCAAGGSDVWFYYVSGSNNPVTITTCNFTGFDTAIMVLDQCGGTVLICNDDAGCAPSGLLSTVTFAATSGTTYYVAFGGFASSQGSATMTITQ